MSSPVPAVAAAPPVQRLALDTATLATWSGPWDQLAVDADALVFSSPAWVSAWAEVFEPEARLELLVAGEPTTPTGVLPLATRSQRLHPRAPFAVRHVTVAGSDRGAADHLGPVATDPDVVGALVGAAIEHAGGRPLVLNHLAPSAADAVEGLTGARPIRRTPVPGIDLRGVEDLEALWSRKMAKNARRADRLMDEAGYRSTWTRIGTHNAEHLDHHARLHALRWQELGRSGLFDAQRQHFLAVLGDRLPEPHGVWHQLIDGPRGPIGSSVVLVYGRTVCTYSTGRDPAFHQFSLGPKLHIRALRRALEAGAVRYEFLRGLEPHKDRLGGIPVEDRTYLLGRGPGAALLRARERHIDRREGAGHGPGAPEADAA